MEKRTLNDYLHRIGVELNSQGLAPTIPTLQYLHTQHTQKIAFENLNPLLGLEVDLDGDAIIKKLMYAERGGYCYEQNLLFGDVLKTIGFELQGLEARVLPDAAGIGVLPRTHMLLLIQSDKTYIADVGFGALTPCNALLLEPEIIQQTPQESYRLTFSDENYTLQVNIRNEWKSLYCFDRQVQCLADYKVANWYNSRHPDSVFVKSLMVARKTRSGRVTVNNRIFTTYERNAPPKKHTVSNAAEMIKLLEDVFALKISGLPNIRARLNDIAFS